MGTGWQIDTNPIATVWTALDAATPASGCMQIVPGSHRNGVINEEHWLDEKQVEQFAPAAKVVDLEVDALTPSKAGYKSTESIRVHHG